MLNTKKINHLEVNEVMYKLINNAIMMDESKPYSFFIYGEDNRVRAHINAVSRLEKIKKWVEKMGGSLKVMDRPLGHKFVVEITDPVAAHLEKHLMELN